MLYIFLAAYNEEKNLPAVFEDIKKQGWKFDYNVLLVNDGSTDNTSGIASEYSNQLPVTIIGHERNEGLGKALQTGFTYLNKVAGPGDLVVTLDADNSHPIEAISAMISKIESGDDLVIASRYRAGGGQKGVSFFRRALSLGANAFLTLLWPVKNVKDYSCGFRMYRGSLVKALFERFGKKFIEETGFSASVEILLKASLVTERIGEVPLILRYDKKQGASKMKIFNTIFRHIALIINLQSKSASAGLLLSLCILLYIIFIHARALSPVMGYETVPWDSAVNIASNGLRAVSTFRHPTLFTHIIALSFKAFGVSEFSARFFGMMNFSLIALLLMALVKSTLKRNEDCTLPAAAALMFFALSPFAVNGSLIIDFSDTTLLTTLIILFHLLYLKVQRAPLWKRTLLLGAVFAACLWGKITTTLFLPASVFIFCVLKGRAKDGFLTAVFFSALGFLIFSASWFLYCNFIILRPGELLSPLKYAFFYISHSSATSYTKTGNLFMILAGCFRSVIWFNLCFVALTLTAAIFNAAMYFKRKEPGDESLLLISSVIISGVYIFMAGGTVAGGFPKYIYPAYTLLCCYNGIFIYRILTAGEDKISGLWFIFFILSVAYYFRFVGDSVYPTYQAKLLYSRSSDLKPLFSYLSIYLVKYWAAPVIAGTAILLLLKRSSKTALLIMLAITIVSVNLSTMLAMNMSAYQTGISYGAEGAEALKSFYKKTAVVYTSREGMIANCGNIKFMLMSEALDNPDKLLELLKTQKPDTFVYGTACNSYSQLRDCIGSEKVSAELKNDYLTLNFGSYTVAQRKKN